jgi:hypothetical protein
MIILISLLLLFFVGFFIAKKSYDYEFLGIVISFISGMYLLIHILFWSTASYDYGIFVAKREAFVETLNDARKNNNPLELAAITKEVSGWNQELAENKYNLKVFLLKDYVDKRVEKLQPIR